MKKNIFFILLFITSFNLVRSQSTSFFEEVRVMKMNLCFKGYFLANSAMDQNRTSQYIGTRGVFIRNDSSMMVAVYLNAGPYRKGETERSVDNFSSQENKSIHRVSKKNEKILKKFGADGGGFEKIEKQPVSPLLPGYGLVGGGMLFSKGDLMFVEIYQREGNGKKMSEKALINFASSFIRFND